MRKAEGVIARKRFEININGKRFKKYRQQSELLPLRGRPGWGFFGEGRDGAS
jgi:hypothetical protein